MSNSCGPMTPYGKMLKTYFLESRKGVGLTRPLAQVIKRCGERKRLNVAPPRHRCTNYTVIFCNTEYCVIVVVWFSF